MRVSSVLIFAVCAALVNINDAKSIKLTTSTGIKERASTKKVSKRVETVSTSSKSVVIASSPDLAVTQKWRGPACIIGGAIAHLAFGSLYCWGNFNSYAPSNLRSDLVFPLTLVAQCLTMPFGPLIVKNIGARSTLLLGAWIMAAGVYFSSFATTQAMFIFFYSLVFGAGIGIAYTAPMIAGWQWMPQSKGLVSGAILMGFGGGGFFFNLIGTKIANPLGVDPVGGKFPLEVYEQFPVMLRKLALIYGVLTFLGSCLISEPVKPAVDSTKKVAEVPGVSIMDALKTKQFYLMWAMIVAAASAGLNVAAMYKQFAGVSPALKGDSYQASVGAVGALFNAMGRLFWGVTSDKIGFKNSFMILTLAQACVQFIYPYSASSKVRPLMTIVCFV
jgi:OFA family oxalate/formate antiporter-like MFS transporter